MQILRYRIPGTKNEGSIVYSPAVSAADGGITCTNSQRPLAAGIPNSQIPFRRIDGIHNEGLGPLSHYCNLLPVHEPFSKKYEPD